MCNIIDFHFSILLYFFDGFLFGKFLVFYFNGFENDFILLQSKYLEMLYLFKINWEFFFE